MFVISLKHVHANTCKHKVWAEMEIIIRKTFVLLWSFSNVWGRLLSHLCSILFTLLHYLLGQFSPHWKTFFFVFLVLVLFFCTDPSLIPDRNCQQCADGWLTFGRSCFYLSTFRLSWDESQRNCSARGGSLAVISSQRVQVDPTALPSLTLNITVHLMRIVIICTVYYS